MRSLVLLLLVPLAAACAGARPVDPAVTAPLDAPFSLRVGEAAAVAGTPLVVRFLGVPQDSRCPEDVVCVWAGDALARVEASGTPSGGRVLELHTGLDPRAAEVDGFRVALEGVEPGQRTDAPVPAERYAATLRVTRLP